MVRKVYKMLEIYNIGGKVKFRNKKEVMKSVYAGLLMILIGFIFWLLRIYALSIGFITGGIILVLLSIYYSTKPITEVIIDERVRRIDEKASSYAFWIVIFTLTAITHMDLYDIISLSLIEAYQIVLLIGLYSWIILRFYFSRRGPE